LHKEVICRRRLRPARESAKVQSMVYQEHISSIFLILAVDLENSLSKNLLIQKVMLYNEKKEMREGHEKNCNCRRRRAVC